MSCQNSMKQRGVVGGLWLATMSGAERALLSLREKAQAAACRQIKVGRCRCTSLEIKSTSIF
ncbi:hypothetical protein MA16_Dca001280 [Dendrobium catenatum]|uniref:Uncharacterized protein n=1 Tax=Dendrobium catenatum TaxID=906689 RepID=A0A2I0WLZ3_9ASPA|nr:hypothetical protein MA16_Dca029205 [Dendrobium catenatum]PKU76675.1 hypothetical protein MA16_Dca001280 [Dendrobium catenatum]